MRIAPLLACGAAAIAAPLALANPALASAAGRGNAGPHAAPDVGASPLLETPPIKSPAFAGYDIGGQDGDVAVTTTFVVPRLKCTKAQRAIAASAGMYEDSTSSNFSSANVFIGCVKGKARYFPFLTVNSNETNLRRVAIRAGDTIILKAVAKTTRTTVSITDATHKFKKTEIGNGYSSFTGFPWAGDVTWSTNKSVLGVPNFGTIPFSNSRVDGLPFGSNPSVENFDRYNSSLTTLQIKTSKFAKNPRSFSTIFKHS